MSEGPLGSEEAELARLRAEKMERYARVVQAHQKGVEYPERPVDLKSQDSTSFLKRYPVALLEFWAGWCRPCLKMRPVVEEVAAEFWGDIVFGRISLDEDPEARERFEVTVLPTLLLFKQGQEIERLLGGVTRQRLEKALEPYAKAPEAPVRRVGHTNPPGSVGG
jgi:thioredoxin 1